MTAQMLTKIIVIFFYLYSFTVAIEETDESWKHNDVVYTYKIVMTKKENEMFFTLNPLEQYNYLADTDDSDVTEDKIYSFEVQLTKKEDEAFKAMSSVDKYNYMSDNILTRLAITFGVQDQVGKNKMPEGQPKESERNDSSGGSKADVETDRPIKNNKQVCRPLIPDLIGCIIFVIGAVLVIYILKNIMQCCRNRKKPANNFAHIEDGLKIHSKY